MQPAQLDQWSMSGRVQAPHRDGGLLDDYSNIDVMAESESEALAVGAMEIARRGGGDPDQARWVGTPPKPWNRSEAVRAARYRAFDWGI